MSLWKSIQETGTQCEKHVKTQAKVSIISLEKEQKQISILQTRQQCHCFISYITSVLISKSMANENKFQSEKSIRQATWILNTPSYMLGFNACKKENEDEHTIALECLHQIAAALLHNIITSDKAKLNLNIQNLWKYLFFETTCIPANIIL